MYSEVIYLVTETYTEDSVGNQIPTVSSAKTYARKQSVRTNEFYQASQTGFKPSAEFVIRKSQYSGQQLVDWGDQRYKLIRTIDKGLYDIVLVCEAQAGKISPIVSA